MSAVEVMEVRTSGALRRFIRLPMRRIIGALGAVAYETYRVYEKSLQ